MPNPTPPAHYDSPWKVALTHAFYAFMAFYFEELCAQIDWSRPPRFRDKELSQLGFGVDSGSVVADKLVEIYLHAGGTQWVLVHVEVQSQHDGAIARRVLEYNYRIYKEYGRPVASLQGRKRR